MAKAKKKTPAKKAPAKKQTPLKKATAKAPAKKKVVKKARVKKTAAPAKKTPTKKQTPLKKPAAKAPAKKKAVKKARVKKTSASAKKKASVKAKTKQVAKKKAVKKPAPKKKVAVKKTTPAKKVPPKKTAAKKAAPVKAAKLAKKTTAKKATGNPPANYKQTAIPMAKSTKKVSLRKGARAHKPAAKPIAFSLDEVRSIANTVSKTAPKETKTITNGGKATVPAKKIITEPIAPAKPSHVAAASLADILGFSPGKTKRSDSAPAGKNVPEKFKRFHKLLIGLRTHLTKGIELHSEETLKRSSKDDAGDLSGYGQHMADAGTDTSELDFALSLVSSEQDALSEIEAAINRIYDGTYGICEITGKGISKERLGAVPFTRYSTEAQKDLERNRHRKRTQEGLFGEHGDDAGKMMNVDGDGD